MPHSLRAKIKGLRYKGIIADKDCVRLCKALDNEGALEQIRAEIIELRSKQNIGVLECLDIIDKYKAESEDE